MLIFLKHARCKTSFYRFFSSNMYYLSPAVGALTLNGFSHSETLFSQNQATTIARRCTLLRGLHWLPREFITT